jgi:phosphatidate cytidylyltransferase
VVTVVAYFVGADALLALVAIGLLSAAAEAFTMLRESSGFRPATLVGMLATVGLVLGAWWKGEGALPLVLAVATVATMLWYLLGVSDARPLANVMATSTVVVWIGLLGSFAALLLRAPHGRGLLFGVFVTVVMADVVAYFGGRSLGKHKLAPRVSPGKTVEGFLAGGAAALVVGAVVGHVIPGWGGVGHGLLLGLVVAVFAPIGDLFESLVKRDLDIKDSGRLLAGHGGLLDRFDSVILVLPAAYYLAVALRLG